mgnify:CR=1 FL=1
MIEFLLIWLTRICTGVIVRRKSDDCMTPGGGSMRTTQVILIGWPFSASFRAGCGGAFSGGGTRLLGNTRSASLHCGSGPACDPD